MELKLILPDDVDAFDIFCYRHEGSLIGVPTIHINENINSIKIYREKNGVYKTSYEKTIERR